MGRLSQNYPRQMYKKSDHRLVRLIVIAMTIMTVMPYLGVYLGTKFYLQRGNYLLAKTEYEAATDAYQFVLRLNPNNAEGYAKLSQAWYKQGNYAGAIAAYDQAIDLNPQIPVSIELGTAYQRLAEELNKQGKQEQAIAAYRQAIQEKPQELSNYLNLGTLLEKQENWAAAALLYENALKKFPKNVAIFTQLGVVWQQQGKSEKALSMYWQAIQLDPNGVAAYRYLAEALEEKDQLTKAIVFYKQALAIAPQDAATREKLCFALDRSRNYQKALEQCQQAILLDPSLSNAKLYVQEVQRKIILQQNPEIATLPESLEALKSDPLFSLKRSVVKVIVQSRRKFAQGTGWVIKRSENTAWIITNRHVINFGDQPQPKTTYLVELYSQPHSEQVRSRLPAQLIQATPVGNWLDLAVLEVSNLPADIQPLSLAESDHFANEPIKTIGHPNNESDWMVSSGEIIHGDSQVLHLSAVLTPGRSGSPVFNSDNQVIGIAYGMKLSCNHQELPWAELEFTLSCGLALPIEAVRNQLQQWQ